MGCEQAVCVAANTVRFRRRVPGRSGQPHDLRPAQGAQSGRVRVHLRAWVFPGRRTYLPSVHQRPLLRRRDRADAVPEAHVPGREQACGIEDGLRAVHVHGRRVRRLDPDLPARHAGGLVRSDAWVGPARVTGPEPAGELREVQPLQHGLLPVPGRREHEMLHLTRKSLGSGETTNFSTPQRKTRTHLQILSFT